MCFWISHGCMMPSLHSTDCSLVSLTAHYFCVDNMKWTQNRRKSRDGSNSHNWRSECCTKMNRFVTSSFLPCFRESIYCLAGSRHPSIRSRRVSYKDLSFVTVQPASFHLCSAPRTSVGTTFVVEPLRSLHLADCLLRKVSDVSLSLPASGHR